MNEALGKEAPKKPDCPRYDRDGDIPREVRMYQIDLKYHYRNTILEAKEKTEKLRDELYEALPSGQISAFDLIKLLQKHINKLDELTVEMGKSAGEVKP